MSFAAELWAEWLAMFHAMQTRGWPVAAPFVGYRRAWEKSAGKRFLYVGKATMGDFSRREFLPVKDHPEAAFDVCAGVAKSVFEDKIANVTKGASFWGFGNDLCKALGGSSGSNLAWSNLARLGFETTNPSAEAYAMQEDLAVRTLQREIQVIAPEVIVFVSANDGKQILLSALGQPEDGSWEKSEALDESGVDDVWWRARQNGLPAVVWMRHPQRCASDKRGFALRKAQELVGLALG